MKLKLNDLQYEIKFATISILKSALLLKEKNLNQELFLDFCKGIWETMEINDGVDINEVLNEVMYSDLQEYVDKYTKEEQGNEKP